MKKLKTSAFMAVFLVLFSFVLTAQENPARERREPPIEIQAKTERQIEEEARRVQPVPEIKEIETKIPEVPKAITREQLTGADKVRLDDLEQRHAQGKITETEYQAEKDQLGRESNLTF